MSEQKQKSFWRRWLSYNPYKKLWSIIGRRMWTHIARDIYHQAEFVVIILCLTVGWFSGRYWGEILSWMVEHPLGALGVLIALRFIWFTLGHFFWGKEWISRQGIGGYKT